MEIVVLSANVSKLRYVNVHGREFAVANIRIIVPGVLDGSNGPLYYPPEEIVRNYQDWNGMPLVVYHPALNGKNVSARSPEILAKQEIGRIYNAKVDGDKGLGAEGWFDVELVKRVDDRVWKDLINGNRIEVSTGLFTENVPAPEGSTYNGKLYKFVAKNYRPDHLAILPDQVGACSIKDGCGVFNSQLIVNPSWVLDHDKWIEAKAQAATEGRADDYAYVTGIYKQMGGRIDESADTSTNNQTQVEDKTMDRAKAIAWLTTNCDCYKGKDSKDKLEKMSDNEFKDVLLTNAEKAIENEDSKFLEWMMNASDDVKGGFVKMIKKNMMRYAGADAPVKPDDDPTKKKPAVPPPANPAPPPKETPAPAPTEEDEEEKKKKMNEQVANYLRALTPDQWKTVLPPSMVENMNFSEKVVANEKMRIITQLTANVGDNNRKAEIARKYMQKGLPELQEMLELMPKPANNQQTTKPNNPIDFFGFSGAPINNTSSVENDVLECPEIDYEADAKIKR